MPIIDEVSFINAHCQSPLFCEFSAVFARLSLRSRKAMQAVIDSERLARQVQENSEHSVERARQTALLQCAMEDEAYLLPRLESEARQAYQLLRKYSALNQQGFESEGMDFTVFACNYLATLGWMRTTADVIGILTERRDQGLSGQQITDRGWPHQSSIFFKSELTRRDAYIGDYLVCGQQWIDSLPDWPDGPETPATFLNSLVQDPSTA